MKIDANVQGPIKQKFLCLIVIDRRAVLLWDQADNGTLRVSCYTVLERFVDYSSSSLRGIVDAITRIGSAASPSIASDESSSG